MQRFWILFVGLVCSLTVGLHAQQRDEIIIEFIISSGIVGDSIDVAATPLNDSDIRPRTTETWRLALGDNVTCTWRYHSDVPVSVSAGDLSRFGNEFFHNQLLDPGDSLVVKVGPNGVTFQGRGAEKNTLSLELLRMFERTDAQKEKWASPYELTTLEDYQRWDAFLDDRLETALEMLETKRIALSPTVFRKLKIRAIMYTQEIRHDAFRSLCAAYWKGTTPLTGESLQEIFKRDFYNDEYRWIRAQPDIEAADMGFVIDKVFCDLGFSRRTLDTLDKPERLRLYRRATEGTFRGAALEATLAEWATFYVIHNGALEAGFPPVYDSLLEEYYNSSSHEAFKAQVRAFERKDRRYGLQFSSGIQLVPYLSLPTSEGGRFDYLSLRGKLALIRFSADGSLGELAQLRKVFGDSSGIVLIQVSTIGDKEDWMASMRRQNNRTKGIVNLFTDEKGRNHPLLNAYAVDSLPTYRLIKPSGLTVMVSPDQVASTVRAHLAQLVDGPYVFRSGESLQQVLFKGDKVDIRTIDDRRLPVKVGTDRYGEHFSVKLVDSLRHGASEYPSADRLLAMSDIEGDFKAFRSLLQGNGVIDDEFNWRFGNGHLVLNGDFFDRGTQVTECLWLIYSLEEKAKAAGGKVHFVLGNHEIMNLSGDFRYVDEKYKRNAELLGVSCGALYGPDTELGRWLRTKHIMVKVGDLLFVHGGVTPVINGLDVSLNRLNSLARPFYDRDTSARSSDDATVRAVFSFDSSPFWYRQYYRKGADQTTQSTIDSTLARFGVRHIVTGHTVVGDTVSVHYGGKVINVDTPHARGKSEALLVEGDRFYRVNTEGKRVLLFEDKRKAVFK